MASSIMEDPSGQPLLPRKQSAKTANHGCCRYDRLGCVCNKEIAIVLIWSAVINGFGYYLFFKTSKTTSHGVSFDYMIVVYIFVADGLGYLLYPVAGLVAEVYWSRYKFMIAGTLCSFIGILIATPSLAGATYYDCKSNLSNTTTPCSIDVVAGSSQSFTYFGIVGVIVYRVGLGLFEANAIQFGADQLQFAPNDKLSVFVYWYFWSTYVLKLVTCYLADFVYFPLRFYGESLIEFLPIIQSVVVNCFSLVLFLFFFVLWFIWKQNLTTDPVSQVNPVKHVYRVMKFVKNHDQPLLRSAFTYGEVPSRMDYAKQRYGGPFTTEQVEDVKTFIRILLVISTLFGMLLQSDFNGLDSSLYIQYLVILLWVPIHMLIIRPCLHRWTSRVTILQKIGVGLLIAFAYNLAMLFVVFLNDIWSRLQLLASILYGCSLVLVFLSTLELILAQSPRYMQGMLIGLWYAYQSVADAFFLLSIWRGHFHSRWFSISSTVLSALSAVLFLFASRRYKYRRRDEVVDINRQGIIEEYTERRLLREQDDESIDVFFLTS